VRACRTWPGDDRLDISAPTKGPTPLANARDIPVLVPSPINALAPFSDFVRLKGCAIGQQLFLATLRRPPSPRASNRPRWSFISTVRYKLLSESNEIPLWKIGRLPTVLTHMLDKARWQANVIVLDVVCQVARPDPTSICNDLEPRDSSVPWVEHVIDQRAGSCQDSSILKVSNDEAFFYWTCLLDLASQARAGM
jgi:hypothetical protein